GNDSGGRAIQVSGRWSYRSGWRGFWREIGWPAGRDVGCARGASRGYAGNGVEACRGALLFVHRGRDSVEHFLGSASTHLLSGLGGFAGRGLRKGDVLQFGTAEQRIRRRRISRQVLETLKPRK